MRFKILYEILFSISVFFSAVSQVLLKKSAIRNDKGRGKEYLNLSTMCAYGMFFLSSIMTTAAYKYVPLAEGQILESGGYIYVSCFSAVFLKEQLKKRELLGILCIIIGIVIFAV